jgi:hypothetical protein
MTNHCTVENSTTGFVDNVILQLCDVMDGWDFGEPADEHSQETKSSEEGFHSYKAKESNDKGVLEMGGQ